MVNVFFHNHPLRIITIVITTTKIIIVIITIIIIITLIIIIIIIVIIIIIIMFEQGFRHQQGNIIEQKCRFSSRLWPFDVMDLCIDWIFSCRVGIPKGLHTIILSLIEPQVPSVLHVLHVLLLVPSPTLQFLSA